MKRIVIPSRKPLVHVRPIKHEIPARTAIQPVQPVVSIPSQVVKQPTHVTSTNRVYDEIILRRGGVFTVNQGYDKTASSAVPIIGAPNTVNLVTQTVPQGGDQSLLITHFANYLSDVMAWGYFTWNMYIDGVPVEAYYGVLDQLGQTNLMRKVGVDILIGGGQTLTIDVVNDALTPAIYNAGVSLIGVYGTYDYNRD